MAAEQAVVLAVGRDGHLPPSPPHLSAWISGMPGRCPGLNPIEEGLYRVSSGRPSCQFVPVALSGIPPVRHLS